MEPFRLHVFVSNQSKPEGVPCCSERGAGAVFEALDREIKARGLDYEVLVTPCGSLGLCEHGSNMVVYPEGVLYSGIRPEDVFVNVLESAKENWSVGHGIAQFA